MLAPRSEPPQAVVARLDHPGATAHVDAVHLAKERQRMVGAEFACAGHERADVLGQATAAESEARVEESPSDARVMTQRVGEHRDIGIDSLAHLRDRVDERDLRGQKRVGGHLDEFRGLQVGDKEGHVLVQQRRVQLADGRLGGHRILRHAKDNPVRMQRVVHGEAFAQEFGVPRHLDVDAFGRQCPRPLGEFGGGADRHRGLSDDDR